jgi:hypothetical protein
MPPDLIINEAAVEHIKQAVESWADNPRDLGLALSAWGRAILLNTDSHAEHIAMIEAGA